MQLQIPGLGPPFEGLLDTVEQALAKRGGSGRSPRPLSGTGKGSGEA